MMKSLMELDWIFDWQAAVAILLVALAAATIARRIYIWAISNGEQGCGACPNKSAPPLVKTTPLFQIQKLPRDPRL